VWGFIAQEVANVLPHATQLRQEFIPNIYELANVSSSNVITFTNFNTADLESNALIRTKGIDGKDHDIHVEEVINEHTIRVVEDLSDLTGSVDETGNVVAGNQLFVYGQEVSDFVFLKKEAIWTVATSALQEVDRIQQQHDAQIADLEAAVTSRDQQIDELRDELSGIVSRLESLEA
jgi:vacuolar-type H+-ATPase subunit I/STV1